MPDKDPKPVEAPSKGGSGNSGSSGAHGKPGSQDKGSSKGGGGRHR